MSTIGISPYQRAGMVETGKVLRSEYGPGESAFEPAASMAAARERRRRVISRSHPHLG